MPCGSVHSEFRQKLAGVLTRGLAPAALSVECEEGFPLGVHKLFAREGFHTLAMPLKFGGGGAGAARLALTIESIARYSPSAALLVFPTNAVLRILDREGTEAQKQRIFGELSAGDKCLAFCLSEPDHGSEAAGLVTRAEKTGDCYVVNGSKAFVTLGPHASHYLTFVRTGPRAGAEGISALLIPKDAPGLSFGKPMEKMGFWGSVTSQMYLKEVEVPFGNVVGGEGRGWRVLTKTANPMRVWGAASLALGNAQGIFDQALAWAKKPGPDGKPAIRWQAVGFALADMKMKIEACRSLIYRTCGLLDSGRDGAEMGAMASMAKCLAADTGVEVGNLAGEVIGREMAVSQSMAGRQFLAAKAVQIFDGSNQIQRMIVARYLASL